MSLSKEEKIVRLRRGIASSETSDALRAIMQADLDELLKPEPVYVAPEVKEKPKPVKKAVKKPVAKKEEPKAPEPKAPELTEERKKAMMDEYAKQKARKKEKEEQEN